jgi:hypothetical protein
MHSETGDVVDPGSMIHVTAGPSVGQAWRFERIIPHQDGHKIHCTRSHPRTGRLHREFHPRVFGCHVVIDVKWYRDRQRMAGWASAVLTQLVLLTVGGVIAWLIAEYGNAEWGGVLAQFGVHHE